MRVGVVGVGRIGEVHARSLAQEPRCSELILHDLNTDQAHVVADRWGATVAADPESLLNRVDAVVIASPTDTHADLVRAAIAGGTPAFCEKPIAMALSAVEALAAEASSRQALVQVGFHYRFDPALRALAAAGAAHEAPPSLLRVHSTTEFAPSPAYLRGAGGLIADKLIHELDMVRWLTGSEVLRVSALAARPPGAEDEPMTAALTLQLSNGGLAAVWGGYRSSAGFDLVVESEWGDTVLIAGNRRPVGDAPQPVHPSTVTDFRDRFAEAYRSEIVAFLDAVAGTAENSCPLDQAVVTQRLVVAAQAALVSGQVIDVGESAEPAGRADSFHL